MSYSIPCSYGDLIDKWTILSIKMEKCPESETDKKTNITREHDLVGKSVIDVDDPLVKELHKINLSLWGLEDQIRILSSQSSYGPDYIACAEGIHKTNDHRYQIKRQLNNKYNSELIEEKLYIPSPNQIDEALTHFPHNAPRCYKILLDIISNNGIKAAPDGVNLYLNFLTVSSFLGEPLPHDFPPIDWLMTFIDTGIIDVDAYRTQVALQLLREGRYTDSYRFLPFMQQVSGPYGISPRNVGNFKPDDQNRLMVIYSSGGLGDIIMFSRLVPLLAQRQAELGNGNKIVYLVDRRAYWMMANAFNVPGLLVTPYTNNLPHFHYHNNISALLGSLDIEQSTVPWYPYLENVQGRDVDISDRFILFGWKGAESNQHEIYNRRVPLDLLLKTLDASRRSSDVQLVTVQRDISPEEQQLLQQYNVLSLSQSCDNQGMAYHDTLTLVKRAEIVISSDTSLLHLAGTARRLDQLTIGLIVYGCEWRWTPDNCRHWYPNIKVIRQHKFGAEWSNVMNELASVVSPFLQK